MKTAIQKWGNSLALRIPKSFAEETGLKQESEVELTMEDNRLIITPAKKDKKSLEELLNAITPENLHGSIDSGSAVGEELW